MKNHKIIMFLNKVEEKKIKEKELIPILSFQKKNKKFICKLGFALLL